MKVCKNVISVVLVFSMLFFTMVSTNSESALYIDTKTNSWKEKINSSLWDKINSVGEIELISVWIWFNDLDKNIIEKRIKERTGITRDDIDSSFDHSFFDTLQISFSDEKMGSFSENLDKYIDSTEELRKEYKRTNDNYQQKRIDTIKEMYTTNNDNIIRELNLSRHNVSFCSSFTPSAIISLNAEQIKQCARDSRVNRLYLYEEIEVPDPIPFSVGYNKRVMHHNTAINNTDFLSEKITGAGVNVLSFDSNYIRPELENYSDIININTVYNVINGINYSASNSEVLPPTTGNKPYHANFCVATLKSYAPNTNVYCVIKNRLDDIEYSIANYNIHLINASVNYGCFSYYDAYSKWFDALVYQTNIPVIASAGNDYSWMPSGFPSVISPANGYNSIAVGAYEASTNKMYNPIYRYNPIESASVSTYKPDVVVAANSTSQAAPSLVGILACMLQAAPALSHHVEETKAIVMASCHRKVSKANNDMPQETMSEGLTQFQGAGAVDSYRIIKAAVTHTYGSFELGSYVEKSLITPIDNYTLKYNDGLNASLAWLVSGTRNQNSFSVQEMGDVQDVTLRLVGGDTNKLSDVTNSGKQMAYISSGDTDQVYSIQATNITPENTRIPVVVGYAWSEQYDMEIADSNMQGSSVVNGNLKVNIIPNNDSINLTDEDILYFWKTSSDGVNWQTLSSPFDHTNTHHITDSDFLKYIKCEAKTSNYSSLYLPTTISYQTTCRVVKYGDVDLNGQVNNNDVVLIQRYLAGVGEFTEENIIAGDVNTDGEVDIVDATLINRFIIGLITSFPVE